MALKAGIVAGPDDPDFGEWLESMFNTGLSLQSDLDSFGTPGWSSANLRQAFSNNGYSLSSNITISIQNPNSKWLIEDNSDGCTYIVRKESGMLEFYWLDAPSLGLLLDKKMSEVQELAVDVPPEKLQSIRQKYPDTAQEKINALPEIKYNKRLAMQKVAEALIEHLEKCLEIEGVQSMVGANNFVVDVEHKISTFPDPDLTLNSAVTINQKANTYGTVRK